MTHLDALKAIVACASEARFYAYALHDTDPQLAVHIDALLASALGVAEHARDELLPKPNVDKSACQDQETAIAVLRLLREVMPRAFASAVLAEDGADCRA